MFGGVEFRDYPDPENVHKLDHNCLPLIHQMTQVGIRVDLPLLRAISADIQTRQAEIIDTLPSIIGDYQYSKTQKKKTKAGTFFIQIKEPFNINSPDHVANLLFHHLKVQGDTPVELTATRKRESTADDVLDPFMKSHPVVPLIGEYRELDKMDNTYATPLQSMVDSDDRIHTRFNPTVASTGRLSSSNPNCFDGDTEVLTPLGWVNFRSYFAQGHFGKGTKVAQWENGQIRFVEPLGGAACHTLVPLIRIHNQHTDIVCTYDHRCLLFNRKTGEQRVVPASGYLRDAKQLHAGYGYGPGLDIQNCELQFIIAAQADGSRTPVGWDFTFVKQRKIERLRNILTECGLKYREKISGDKTRFYVPDPDSSMRAMLGTEKKFGGWLLDMDQYQMELFESEIWHWDGCITRRNHYASKFKSNADLVQAVFVRMGYTANVRKYTSQAGSISWQVDITRRNYTLTANTKIENFGFHKVFCVKVPSSFLVIRRSGKVSITGNCQNIPTRSPLGKRIRQAFIARPGCVLVSNDLSQIEMRWAAHGSGDENMITVFWENKDIHTMTACGVFDREYDYVVAQEKTNPSWYKQWKAEERAPSKNLGFGVLYGLTPPGLRRNIFNESNGKIDWSEEKCAGFIEKFFTVYPGLNGFIDLQHRRCTRYGLCWDAFGRPRLVPEGRSCHTRIKNEGLRKAGNHYEQSSAQGTIKLAMAELIEIYADFQKYFYCNPLLQIHDEIISEVDQSYAKEVAHENSRVMAGASPLDVPVESSSDFGERWGDLK